MPTRMQEPAAHRAARREMERVVADAARAHDVSLTDAVFAAGAKGRGVVETSDAGQRVFDISSATAKLYGPGRGALQIPLELLTRDLLAGTGSAGGYLAPTGVPPGSTVVEALRPVSLLARLGAQIWTGVRGRGSITLPRTSANVSASWAAENSAASGSTPNFDAGCTVTPQTVTANATFSRRLQQTSGADVEAFVRGHLLRALFAEIDRVALAGSGAGSEPAGVLYASGTDLQALGTDGAALTHANVVAMEKACGQANAEGLAFVSNPSVRAKLRATDDGIGAGGPLWDRDNRVLGMPAHASTSIPSNLTKGGASGVCSGAIVGDFAQLVVVIWGAVDLIVPSFTSVTGALKITALADVGIGLLQPAAFSVARDVLTA